MTSPRPLRRPLTLLAAALLCTGAQADDKHYRNILIGDRAMGMGGAYTAIADDPSGLYYNPAGVVYTAGRNISASVNAYTVTTTVYKDVLAGSDWTRESSNLLPNFFGMVQPFGDGVIGFSYAVTDSVLEDQDQVFRNFGGVDSFFINVNNQDKTYKIGPSYAQELSDDLSIGVTLYAHMRSYETITNQYIRLNDSRYEWSSLYRQSDEFGIEPVFGLMWSPQEQISVGLAIRQATILTTTTDEQLTCASDISPNGNSQCELDSVVGTMKDPSQSSSDNKRLLPVITSIGVAWFPNNKLLLSGDFIYYTEQDDVTLNREPVWNLSLGAEYYYAPNWAARAGFYTNHANTPEINTSGVNQPEHINFYGVTGSVSRFTRTSSITGGINLAFGSGQAQIISGQTLTQEVEAMTLTLFLSTAYTY